MKLSLSNRTQLPFFESFVSTGVCPPKACEIGRLIGQGAFLAGVSQTSSQNFRCFALKRHVHDVYQPSMPAVWPQSPHMMDLPKMKLPWAIDRLLA